MQNLLYSKNKANYSSAYHYHISQNIHNNLSSCSYSNIVNAIKCIRILMPLNIVFPYKCMHARVIFIPPEFYILRCFFIVFLSDWPCVSFTVNNLFRQVPTYVPCVKDVNLCFLFKGCIQI